MVECQTFEEALRVVNVIHIESGETFKAYQTGDALPSHLLPPQPSTPEDDARDRFDNDKLFKAKCISDLAFRLGKSPAQLTVTEIRNERDRIANIYRNL